MDTPRWFCWLALLSALSLSACGASSDGSSSSSDPQPTVTTLVPDANERAATLSAAIKATFDANMSAAEDTTFVVGSSQTGKLSGIYLGGGSATLEFDPDFDFFPGEEVEVSLTDGLSSTAGRPAISFVYRFRAGPGASILLAPLPAKTALVL